MTRQNRHGNGGPIGNSESSRAVMIPPERPVPLFEEPLTGTDSRLWEVLIQERAARAAMEQRVAALEECLASLQPDRDEQDSDRMENQTASEPHPALEVIDEVGTEEASQILGCSKDTVLKYRQAGLLPSRNIASPGSTKPNYRYPRKAVLELRNSYTFEQPPARPRREESARRRTRGAREFKHLDLGDP